MRSSLFHTQSRQRAGLGLGGVGLAIVLAVLVSVVTAEARPSQAMMQAYVADIYNASSAEHTAVLRAARTRQLMTQTVNLGPGGTARIYVSPNIWRCGTQIEVSIDGQSFQRLEGETDICQPNQAGDRPVIVIIQDRVELVHVDVD